MADPHSLYSEVRRLIALRHATPALQSTGKIEFICDGSEGHPLVYTRSTASQKILVIINPTDRSFKYRASGDIIYSLGKVTTGRDGIEVPAVGAAFCNAE